jgi:hypothetical protein
MAREDRLTGGGGSPGPEKVGSPKLSAEGIPTTAIAYSTLRAGRPNDSCDRIEVGKTTPEKVPEKAGVPKDSEEEMASGEICARALLTNAASPKDSADGILAGTTEPAKVGENVAEPNASAEAIEFG